MDFCYKSAFECWTKAAGLGDIDAHFCLSILYRKGEGVEKNEKKQIYHLDEAAIAGHPRAREIQSWMSLAGKWKNRKICETFHHCRQSWMW